MGNDAGEVVVAVAASAFATFMTSFMWEKAWKRRVFGSEDEDEEESAGRGDAGAGTRDGGDEREEAAKYHPARRGRVEVSNLR